MQQLHLAQKDTKDGWLDMETRYRRIYISSCWEYESNCMHVGQKDKDEELVGAKELNWVITITSQKCKEEDWPIAPESCFSRVWLDLYFFVFLWSGGLWAAQGQNAQRLHGRAGDTIPEIPYNIVFIPEIQYTVFNRACRTAVQCNILGVAGMKTQLHFLASLIAQIGLVTAVWL